MKLNLVFLIAPHAAATSRGAMAMTWVPLYRPPRNLRSHNRRRQFSSPDRAQRRGMPRLSTIRLVVLLGILAAIFVKEGLGSTFCRHRADSLASEGADSRCAA